MRGLYVKGGSGLGDDGGDEKATARSNNDGSGLGAFHGVEKAPEHASKDDALALSINSGGGSHIIGDDVVNGGLVEKAMELIEHSFSDDAMVLSVNNGGSSQAVGYHMGQNRQDPKAADAEGHPCSDVHQSLECVIKMVVGMGIRKEPEAGAKPSSGVMVPDLKSYFKFGKEPTVEAERLETKAAALGVKSNAKCGEERTKESSSSDTKEDEMESNPVPVESDSKFDEEPTKQAERLDIEAAPAESNAKFGEESTKESSSSDTKEVEMEPNPVPVEVKSDRKFDEEPTKQAERLDTEVDTVEIKEYEAAAMHLRSTLSAAMRLTDKQYQDIAIAEMRAAVAGFKVPIISGPKHSTVGEAKLKKLKAASKDLALAKEQNRGISWSPPPCKLPLPPSRTTYRVQHTAARKKGIEPVGYNGTFIVPSDALTGNKDIDALNHVLAESYGAISSLLHRRCEVAAFHDACSGVIFPGMDTKLSDCVKDLRHECGKIRRMILGMGGKPLNEPSQYWWNVYNFQG